MGHRLPAVLLAVVAALQMILAHTAGLSAWKGGGFGMFSTLDGRPHRGMRIRLEAADRSEEIETPPSLEDEAAAASTLPTAARLERFAHEIAARELRHGRAVERVHLEVWRTDFDPYSLAPGRRQLATRLVRIDRALAGAGGLDPVP
jgi:hypothetical protein